LNLKSNLIIGFGISDNATFSKACEFANGAIIGSAFINFLEQKGIDKVGEFISTIKNN
jgi:tryptophan synthase alpha chain